MGDGWGMLRGSLGARGGLGNAWECFGEFWGGLGRFAEGLANAWGMPRDAWGGLGRLAEGCSLHARPFSGLAWEAWGALGMPVHAAAVAVSNALMQKAKTSLFTFNTSHFPVSLSQREKVPSPWHQFLGPRFDVPGLWSRGPGLLCCKLLAYFCTNELKQWARPQGRRFGIVIEFMWQTVRPPGLSLASTGQSWRRFAWKLQLAVDL